MPCVFINILYFPFKKSALNHLWFLQGLFCKNVGWNHLLLSCRWGRRSWAAMKDGPRHNDTAQHGSRQMAMARLEHPQGEAAAHLHQDPAPSLSPESPGELAAEEGNYGQSRGKQNIPGWWGAAGWNENQHLQGLLSCTRLFINLFPISLS